MKYRLNRHSSTYISNRRFRNPHSQLCPLSESLSHSAALWARKSKTQLSWYTAQVGQVADFDNKPAPFTYLLGCFFFFFFLSGAWRDVAVVLVTSDKSPPCRFVLRASLCRRQDEIEWVQVGLHSSKPRLSGSQDGAFKRWIRQLHPNDVVAKSVDTLPLYPAIGFLAVDQPRPAGLEGGLLQQQHSGTARPSSPLCRSV